MGFAKHFTGISSFLTFMLYLQVKKNLNEVKSKQLDSLAQSKEFLTVSNG